MSDLENHPFVQKVNDYFFVVEGSADKYDVLASDEHLGEWVAVPSHGSPSMRAANLRSREDAEAWLATVTSSHRSLHEALTYALTRVGA